MDDSNPHGEFDEFDPEHMDAFISDFQTHYKVIALIGRGVRGCVFEVEKSVVGVRWKRAVRRIALSESIIENMREEVEKAELRGAGKDTKLYDAWIEEPPTDWQKQADERLLKELNEDGILSCVEECAILYMELELYEFTRDEWSTVADDMNYLDKLIYEKYHGGSRIDEYLKPMFFNRIHKQSPSAPVEVVPESINLQFLQTNYDEDFDSTFLRKYKPLKILGQGTYGCVFKVEKDLRGVMDIKRAVKRIALERKKNVVDIALREVAALLALDNPGIVSFFNAWIENPPEGWQASTDEKITEGLNYRGHFTYKKNCCFLYIEMELCEWTLEEWLSKNKSRNLRQSLIWFWWLVSAVAYIHEKKYIYRDLKPSNILFTAYGRLKICDFGIITDRAINDDDGEEASVERTFAMGTEMYMAPEQPGWADYSSKVDIFTLGLILVELCVVIPKDEKMDVFDNYRNGKPNNVLYEYPDAEKLVVLMTAKNESERPNCEQILNQLVVPSQIACHSAFLDGFEPLSILGQGKYSVVYKAKNVKDQLIYAVKRIALDISVLDQTKDAISSRSFLKHAGIVRMYNMFDIRKLEGWQRRSDAIELPKLGCQDLPVYRDDSNFLYLQMELCQYSLERWLRNNNLRDLNQSKLWFGQLVSAIEYLHIYNRIHTDLKPTNILLDVEGRIKLGDLDKLKIGEAVPNNEIDSDCMYKAPEQLIPDEYITPKSDVFTLGLILTEFCVAMTVDTARKRFDDLHRGSTNNILEYHSEVADVIHWLSNPNVDERPEISEILQHSLFSENETAATNASFKSEFLTNFKALSVAGRSAFNLVFQARSLADNNIYAVKRSPLGGDIDVDFNEVRALASLDHEGIVKLYNYWIERPPNGWQRSSDEALLPSLDKSWVPPGKCSEQDWVPVHPDDCAFIYVQLELCSTTLASVLKEDLRTDEQREMIRNKSWLKQIVSAVGYLHSKKIVLQKLKPKNIMFDAQGRIKICNFDATSTEIIRKMSEIDVAESNSETCMYMAPEQAEAYEQGVSSCNSAAGNIFSLGLIFMALCIKGSSEMLRMVFDNVRRGKKSRLLEDHPEVQEFVAWLTNVDSTKRPTCEMILAHEFLA